MKKILLTLAITFYAKFLFAQTFEPFVIIDPPNPMVGDTIRVGVAHTLHPPCLILPIDNFQGLSHIFEFSGSEIRLTAVTDFFLVPICFPFPISPAIRAYYELGQLPEGIYTLETQISGISTFLPIPIPNPPGLTPLVYGPTFAFEVTAPQVINTLSINWQLLLIILLLIITFMTITKGKHTHLK